MDALTHFRTRLTHETDPADTWAALQAGADDLVIVDCRSRDAYAAGHVRGAVSLPHGEMDQASTATWDRDARYVTYCWGPGCNAATKGAAALAALGFRVQEMIGGIEYWEREGYPVDTAG